MLKHVLNDTAVVKAVSSTNEYNEDVFSTPKNIKCKIEFAKKLETSSVSSLQKHPLRMFCYETVNLNDVVSYQNNDYRVIQVNSYNDLDGCPMFYEVFLL